MGVHAGSHGSDMGSYSCVRPDARGNRDSYRYAFASSRSYASRVRYRSRSTRAVSQPPGVGVLRLSDPRYSAESRPPSFGDLRPKSLQTRRSRRALAVPTCRLKPVPLILFQRAEKPLPARVRKSIEEQTYPRVRRTVKPKTRPAVNHFHCQITQTKS